MININHLRILILISWLIYLCEVLSFQFYDPTLYSPILHLAKIVLDRALNLDIIFYFLLVVEAFLLIYASAALWLGYLTGKWAFTLYIILVIIDNYFISVQAFSSLDKILENLNFIVVGMILLALYTSPLKEKLAVKKPFQLGKFLKMFFVFFILLFALPILLSYI